MDEHEKQNQSDHDLLIRVDTKLEGLVADMKDLRDGFSSRLGVVEQNKISAAEVQRMKHEADMVHKDHESRIRRLERWGFIAIGAMLLAQIIIAAAK